MLLNVGFWDTVLKPDDYIAGRHTLDRVPHAERGDLVTRFVPESGRAIFEIMHWAWTCAGRAKWMSASWAVRCW